MKRTLPAWVVALLAIVLVIVPAANGVCGLGCDLDRQSTARAAASHERECPLHHQAGSSQSQAPQPHSSDRCRHDHSAGRVGLPPLHAGAPTHVMVSITPSTIATPATRTSARIGRVTLALTPPYRPSRRLALRI
jgi:hypothetical protein